MDGGPGKVQVSMRLPAEMYEDLGKVARVLERDRTWVMLRALRCYLEAEGADILQDADGLAALERGEGIDLDEVLDEAEELIGRAEARRAAS